MMARYFKYKENSIILMGDLNDILYFRNQRGSTLVKNLTNQATPPTSSTTFKVRNSKNQIGKLTMNLSLPNESRNLQCEKIV